MEKDFEEIRKIRSPECKIRLNNKDVGVYIGEKQETCCESGDKYEVPVVISKSNKEKGFFNKLIVYSLYDQEIERIKEGNVLYDLYREFYNGGKLN